MRAGYGPCNLLNPSTPFPKRRGHCMKTLRSLCPIRAFSRSTAFVVLIQLHRTQYESIGRSGLSRCPRYRHCFCQAIPNCLRQLLDTLFVTDLACLTQASNSASVFFHRSPTDLQDIHILNLSRQTCISYHTFSN